ncbi:MAG TPA: TOBE domain-containing protein, partial [Acidimicrobiales bacterium]|nr:TOBE domain-containing protein [Acidimicrobiales bacterium]
SGPAEREAPGPSGPPEREAGSPATVALVTYYGHDQLVEVALDGGTVLRARLGAERLFSAGERVRAELDGRVIAYAGNGLPPV